MKEYVMKEHAMKEHTVKEHTVKEHIVKEHAMRTRRLTLTIVLTGALVAATALAQGPRAQAAGTAGRPGMAAQRGAASVLGGGMHSDLAELLGVSEEALTAERAAGKTVADILVEHGLTTAEASAKLVAARDARIDVAVGDGDLDAQRAAVMKSRSEAAVAALLTREAGPHAGAVWDGSAPGFGRGMAAGARGAASPLAMGPQARSGLQRGFGGQAGMGRMSGYGAGYGPGAGIHRPGTGFQPGFRFAPTQP